MERIVQSSDTDNNKILPQNINDLYQNVVGE